MKLKDALKLESGQKIMHNRYGECSVKEVVMSRGELFGVVITPITENGGNLLRMDLRSPLPAGTDIPDFLEDSIRRLL